MKIAFLCNEVAGGWSPRDKRLGGTEESLVQWSNMLMRKGHDVTIYMNGAEGVFNGVLYKDRETYSGGYDVCLNVKSSEVAPKEPTIYFTNETDATSKDLSRYRAVVWPSQWADENIPVNNPIRFILPHGFDNTKIKPAIKIPKQCLYASSPDRGLATLEAIWPSVVDRHPDAQLYVTYGGKIDTPNTICGNFSEEEMNRLYAESDLWLHPCSGGELFGITAVKAQAAGCVPVYFPTMALAETVKHGVPCSDAADMYYKLCEILDNTDQKNDIRQALANTHYINWEESTMMLLDIIDRVLHGDSGNTDSKQPATDS